eukprot:scpid45728/ scgid0251/ Major facilitator superfamily domain-containing protein 10; Tetracycline transporter-like protein
MRRAKNTEDDSGAEDNGGFESTVSSPSDRAGGIGQEPALGASYRSSMMRVVMLSLLIELLGFTVILPLLPSILEYYSKSDQNGLYTWVLSNVNQFRVSIGGPQLEKFNTVLFGGLIGSLFSFLQFLSNPIIGALSDVYGRRPILLLCMAGMVLSYAVWAVSFSFEVFLIARVIGGIAHGNVSLSTAIVADITPPKSKQRSRGMAMIGVAFSIGFIVGPMIGAAFSMYGVRALLSSQEYPFQLPALFAVAMATLDLLFLWRRFRETLPEKNRASSLGDGIQDAVGLINPVSLFTFSSALQTSSSKDQQSVRLLGWTYFLYLLLFSGLEYSLTFLTHDKFQYSSMQQGRMFVFIGAIMALVQGGFLRRMKPGSEKRTATIGMVALIPGMFMVGLASSTVLLYSGLALYSFGAGTVVSCLTTMVSDYGSVSERGRVLGIFRSLGALSRAIGPALCCSIYWSAGPWVCYMLGGLLFIVPILLLQRVKATSE